MSDADAARNEPSTPDEQPQAGGRRADAKRNLESLLQAAKAVFAETGVDAPVREIAERAGVGVGTFYRHFPQRSDLIEAVFRQEMDACAAAASTIAADHEPGPALMLDGGRWGQSCPFWMGLSYLMSIWSGIRLPRQKLQ